MPEHVTQPQLQTATQSIQITKWQMVGLGDDAIQESGSKVMEGKVNNTGSGLIKIKIPAKIGFTKITNIQLTVEGGGSALKAARASYEDLSLSGFTVRVVRSKQIVIPIVSDLAQGKTFDPVEQCPDTSIIINIRVAGT